MILPLHDPRVTLDNGGGKAANLGALLRAGLPVPDGFVITTDAYRAFVADNGLTPRYEEDVEGASARIRAAFEAGQVSPALAAAITQAAAGLGAVAVRSSATAEDLPDASFAGQQDTYLNVQGADALIDAVRRCWGSLWTARAMAYRARQGIAPDQVALAVVVQRMAPAQAAGVLFTVHPVSGRADRMVLNATWGLGEALVSGRVNPDTIVADASSGRVLKATVGEKLVQTARTEVGTEEIEVSPERRAARSVSDTQVAALVALGRQCVAVFGGPQDVEWAIVDDQPVLLQSRAITTAVVPGDDAWAPTTRAEPWPFDFWTQQDMGERWPEPLSPLTWSVCEPMNQDIIELMLDGLDAPYAHRIQWSKRAFGRVYMNEGAMLYAYIHGLGMPISMLRSACTHPGSVPADPDRWRFDRVMKHIPYFWRVMTTWEKKVDLFEADFPKIDAWVDSFMAEDLSGRADEALLTEALDTWMGRVNHYVAFHTSATSLSMSSYDELEAFVKKQGGDAGLAQELVGGINGVLVAEMGPMLAAMAAKLHTMGLGDEVLALPAEQALALVRAHPRAEEFTTLLDTFLRRHGHRGAIEAELRYPRWSEAPELIIEQLGPYLRGAPAPSGAPAAARREEATRTLEARLGWFGKAGLRRAMTRAHRFTRMRDNGQSYVVKLLMPVRRCLAELGRRLVTRGRLRSADDVFFLLVEELRTPDGDLQARADARRVAYDHWFTQPAPDVLDAGGEPVEEPVGEGEAGVLTGVAASRGTVTGIARVVLSPSDAGRLQPGEILVTRATDPGWTPVFSIIGGAVLEIGGMLSHGAIVAREYGLPAVVNVPQATRKIVDGQTITVDGTTGRVTIG